ncbi:MAG: hypothetical protein JWN63_390 [Candidatus Acidoferrum typicum]|nr:hypothetical protein [Candidatus Acidoferrum typicum]
MDGCLCHAHRELGRELISDKNASAWRRSRSINPPSLVGKERRGSPFGVRSADLGGSTHQKDRIPSGENRQLLQALDEPESSRAATLVVEKPVPTTHSEGPSGTKHSSNVIGV